MIKLIKADLYKETRKNSFLLSCILVITITIILLFFSNKNISLKKDYNYLNPILSEKEYKDIYKYGDYDYYLEHYSDYKNSIILDNQSISLNKSSRAKYLMMKITSLLYLMGILMIFKSFHSLSYDFQNKTIRYVFLSNNKRTTILLSKIISLIIQLLFFIILSLMTMLITVYLLTGENTFLLNHIFIYNNELIKTPFLMYLILLVLVFLFPIIFMILLTIFICILTSGSTIALVSSIIIYLLGTTISNFLINYNIKIIQYTFIPYLDYTYFINNASISLQNIIYNTNFSIINGIVILFVYSLIFTLLSAILIHKDV